MRAKTIAVTYGRKFNLGDFNSLHIELTAWADLDEGEDAQGATAALFAEVKEAVREQALPALKAAHKPKAVNLFTGVPIVEPVAENEEDE